MNHVLRKLLVLAVLSGLFPAAFAAPSVTDLKVRQRYPWNNLVDIEFKVSGAPADGAAITFAVEDTWSPGDTLNMKTLVMATDKTTPAPASFKNGANHIIWKADADLGLGQTYGGRVMKASIGGEEKAKSAAFFVNLDVVNGIRMLDVEPYFFFSSSWNGSDKYTFSIDGKPVSKFRSYADGAIYPQEGVTLHKTSEFRLSDGIETFVATGVVATVISGGDAGPGFYWELWPTAQDEMFRKFVYLIDEDYEIRKNMTIPPGAVVKVVPGVTLTIAEGVTLDASGAIITSADDATVGGDLNRDFGAKRPNDKDYVIKPLGNFVTNSLTQVRYAAIGASADVVELTEDTYWACDEEHVIDCNLVLAEGVTLEIEPGTVVRFKRDASLTVDDGTCIACGVQFDSENGADDGIDSYFLWGEFVGDLWTYANNLSDPMDVLIAEDAIWSPSYAPVVRSNLRLAEGVNLTIESGTQVRFKPGTSLTVVDGTCNASGVVFDSENGADDGIDSYTLWGEFVGDIRTYAKNQFEPMDVLLAVNAQWTKDDAPIVRSRLSLKEGTTLSIDRGAVVRFAAGTRLSVDGGTCFASGVQFDSENGEADGLDSYAVRGTFRGDLETYAKNLSEPMSVQLAEDAQWGKSDAPVVRSRLTVPLDVDLSFESGTEVRFVDGTALNVRGLLRAAGVTFAPLDASGTYGFTVGYSVEGDPWTRFVGLENPPAVYLESDLAVPADREVVIRNTFVVPIDRSLSFAPGTTVKLAQGANLNVYGKCVAAGVTFEPMEEGGTYAVDGMSGPNSDSGIFGDMATSFCGTGSKPVVRLSGSGLAPEATDLVIRENLLVPLGETLTFVPGATVKVADGVTIKLWGDCRAEGVVFSPLEQGASYRISLGDRYTAPAVYGDFGTEFRGASLGDSQQEAPFRIQLSRDLEVPADGVTVVRYPFVVPSDRVLTFASGCVVKFESGASLSVLGQCQAGGVIFTHICDDTVGGDTDGDGGVSAPVAGDYSISGNVIANADTEFRYGEVQRIASEYSGELMFPGYNVYVVSNTVVLKSGAEVTIGPGAVFKFAAGCGFAVNAGAKLTVRGTKAAPAVFTSIRDDEWGGDTNGDGESQAEPGDWKGFVISGAADMDYCYLTYGSNGTDKDDILTVDGGTVNFSNGLLAHGQRYAVGLESGSLSMNNTVVTDFYCAFRHWLSDPIVNCVVCDCTRLSNNNGQNFVNCIIQGISEAWDGNGGSGNTYGHCVIYNSKAHELKTPPAHFVGENGNLWDADPMLLDPDGGDFRIAADSPCVDAGDGTVAPPTDRYGRPRMDARRKTDTGIPDADGICPDIGVYEVDGAAANAVPDLTVLSVQMPAAARAGEPIDVTYVVSNRAAACYGTVRDAFSFEAADEALGGQRVSGGEVLKSYSLESNGVARVAVRLTVPSLKSGAWRLSVTVNAERDVYERVTANNTAKATGILDVSLPTIATDGQRVELAAGANVYEVAALPAKGGAVVLTLPAGAAAYGANGYVPGADRSDATAIDLGGGRMALVFPARNEGMKAYLAIESENGGSVSVEVAEAGLALYRVEPNRVAATDGVSVTVTGTGLSEELPVTLGGRTAACVTKVNAAQVVATFDLAGLAAGAAEVAVSGGAGRAALPVEVYKPSTGPKLEAKLVLPSSVRDGRVYTAWIQYANVGDEDMPAPIFTVKRTDSSTLLKTMISDDFAADSLHVVGIGSAYPAGVLAAGDSGRIPFYFIPNGAYELALSHALEETAPTAYPQFTDTADYRRAVTAAATRLNARGVVEYRVQECVDLVLAERAERPLAAISGTLVDSQTRAPLANVMVRAVLTNDTSVTALCETDESGRYSLTMLSDGDWQLSAEACVMDGTNIASVVGQRDVNAHVLPVRKLPSVSGTVLTADTSEPLARAAVRLHLNGGKLACEETETDESGAFRFDGVLPGTYTLVVNSVDGYVGDVVTNVVLSLGDSHETGAFELKKGAVLYGKVTLEDAAVTNGTVYACFADGSAARAACSTNGTYCFDGLPPYAYRVRYSGVGIRAGFVDVPLAAGETKELNLKAEWVPLFFPILPRGYGTLTTQFMVSDPTLAAKATEFAWDFDNDGKVDSYDEMPTHTYDAVGTYDAKLVITTPQGKYTSLYRQCVTVEKAIENVLRGNAFRVDETAGVDCTALGEDSLTLVGTPPITLKAGVVLGGSFGKKWFIRKITGVVQDGSTYVLTTEKASLEDLYESYCCVSCQDVVLQDEEPEPAPVLKSSKALSAGVGSALLSATNNPSQSGSESSSVKVVAGGGVKLTPSNVIRFKTISMNVYTNGHLYSCIGVVGEMDANYTTEFFGEVGVQWNKPFPLGVDIPTAVPFVEVQPSLEFGVNVGASGKASGTVLMGARPSVKLAMEQIDGGKWRFADPWDGLHFHSTPAELVFDGKAGLEVYLKLEIKLKAFEVVNVGLGDKLSLAAELSGGSKSPTTFEFKLENAVTAEANLFDASEIPAIGEWLDFKVGISGEWKTGSYTLIKAVSPLPDFSMSPDHGMAPLVVSFADKTKDGENRFNDVSVMGYQFDGLVTPLPPTHWEWDLFVADSTLKDPPSQTYYSEGVHTISLSVKNAILSPAFPARKKLYVGVKKPPEDDEEEDDRGGDDTQKSCDPNEMAGPLGAGDPETERFVKPGEWMDYTIYFENKADADVPAQEVFVDAQLSEWLDWSTFEMGEVAFNNQNETVLAGLKNGLKTVAQNGADYKVQLSVEFDETTGKVHWYLRSYDPNRSDYGYWPASDDAGFLPPNDETHRGEGHITYRVKVREDTPKGARIDASASIVFDKNDPIETDPAWWNTVGSVTAEETSGQYVKLDLVEDLGLEIPGDVDYAIGDKVTVKVEGLAKGLKLVATPVYADPKAKKKVIVDYVYTIEGVPTVTVDFETQPMYARVTITYKDKTKTADGTGKAETLQPVALAIEAPEPTVLTAGVLSQVYEPVDIATLWPEVAKAKENPKDWSFKGWPAGIKYTTKDVTKKNKDKSVTTNAVAYSVYGTPTKAGVFMVTATHKHKIDGKSVSETFSATFTVWGNDGKADFRYVDQAYVATETKTLDATWKSFSGLPAGIKYTTKAVTTKNKDKSVTTNVVAYSLYGTPTKPGVFAVTATKADPTDEKGKKTVKETFLWKVEPGENDGFLETMDWNVADSAVTVMAGVIQTNWTCSLPADAKVTASGLPSGLKLAQDKKTKAWTLAGTPTKAGNFVVTFKTVRNGVTVTERLAIVVTANEWTGSWYGVQYAGGDAEASLTGDADASLLATVTISANGTVKLVYTEASTNYNAKGAVQSAVRKTTVTVKNLDANGTTATLVLPKNKKDPLSEDRTCVLDFVNGELKVDGAVTMRLFETDTDATWPEVTTVVMEEVNGGETNAYGYVTATYNAKKGTFALAGKLWDGTAVKGTATALADGVISPVLVTDKAKNAVSITLGSVDGDLLVFVRENGELVPVGRKLPNGYEPWSGSFAAAELKSKKFNTMSVATQLVVLTDAGETGLPLAEKDRKASVSAQGLVKFTVTDADGWKWVCELLPVDNGGARQFRGIATGTKKGEPTQACPVWAE